MPNPIDISQLGLPELHALALEVRERIASLEEQERRRAFDRMMELAAGVGLSPRELLRMYGEPGAAAAAPAPAANKPVYRNPDNPRESWSGRGRRPSWLVAWESAGKDVRELLG